MLDDWILSVWSSEYSSTFTTNASYIDLLRLLCRRCFVCNSQIFGAHVIIVMKL